MPLTREQLEIPAGKYNTIKVVLNTYIDSKATEKGEIYAWVTDDSSRVMVKLSGEASFGKFSFELMRYRPNNKMVARTDFGSESASASGRLNRIQGD